MFYYFLCFIIFKFFWFFWFFLFIIQLIFYLISSLVILLSLVLRKKALNKLETVLDFYVTVASRVHLADALTTPKPCLIDLLLPLSRHLIRIFLRRWFLLNCRTIFFFTLPMEKIWFKLDSHLGCLDDRNLSSVAIRLWLQKRSVSVAQIFMLWIRIAVIFCFLFHISIKMQNLVNFWPQTLIFS